MYPDILERQPNGLYRYQMSDREQVLYDYLAADRVAAGMGPEGEG